MHANMAKSPNGFSWWWSFEVERFKSILYCHSCQQSSWQALDIILEEQCSSQVENDFYSTFPTTKCIFATAWTMSEPQETIFYRAIRVDFVHFYHRTIKYARAVVIPRVNNEILMKGVLFKDVNTQQSQREKDWASTTGASFWLQCLLCEKWGGHVCDASGWLRHQMVVWKSEGIMPTLCYPWMYYSISYVVYRGNKIWLI